MTINNNRFDFIPLTHILLACTITTILSAVAIFHNLVLILTILYGATILFFMFKKKYTQCFIWLICALFSTQAYLTVQRDLKKFQEHASFLQTPCIVKGVILQKQASDLHKEQTTLLLQTFNIYNKAAGVIKASKKIVLLMPSKRAQKFLEGQTLTIFKAMLSQPKPDEEYRTYLIKEGIWATAFITSERIFINNGDNRSWFAQSSTLFAQFLHRSTINLFNPLFLGKREKTITNLSIQHQSLYWGIVHHMARSGIHLVTLFGLFMGLFHYARIKHFYRYLICGILMFGYLEISIPSLSFLRALSMIMIQIIGKMHKFQYSSVHALTLTTLFTVSYNPWCILFLDFQLSFGITAVIIWLFQRKWAKTVAFAPKIIIPS
ncbi:hypothetical protein A3J41_00610 [candidate division TM6 bacterium RIFCSPHIGHO2_12_FULL_38_8]|nr:MAG: hypothetical protein A3J41_00610 [candidate division TM6 bacterium RIFCSPHIGHO2_12_FULL_38_8]